MRIRDRFQLCLAAIVLASTLFNFDLQARADTIIKEWANVKAPPPSVLRSVTVDPKTTALLILDLTKQTCNAQRRPRCLLTLPKVKTFLARARAHKMLVIYSIVSGGTKADINPAVAPRASDPIVSSSANKFIHTDLLTILRKRHIKTVITVGTASQGAVLFTASEAVFHGFKVVFPVDGVSADNTYYEQAVAYILPTAPTIGQSVTLTRFDMINW